MAITSIGLRRPSFNPEEEARHETRSTSEMLLDAASRNPSLAGRELLIEIISRGYEREPDSAPDFRGNLREVMSPREGYTRAEHADLLGREHKLGRDLYEHGATIKGNTLIIPAEAHELSEERDSPFLISISYAWGKIPDREKAERFVELGLAISGETADTETRLTVFKHYYDQITKDERGRYLKVEERVTATERTLVEMTEMAAQMKALETSQDDLTRRAAGSIEQMRESERVSQAESEEERDRLWFEDRVNDRREESVELKNYNHEMKRPGKLDLKALRDRLGPFERNFLYQEINEKEQALSRRTVQEKAFPDSPPTARVPEVPTQKKEAQAHSIPPKNSPAYKEYIVAARRHENQLLVEAASQFKGMSGPTVEEARKQLSFITQQQIRVQSQRTAWADIAPPEILEENRSPEAERLDRTIAHAMDHLQNRARLAKDVRQDFIDQKVGEAEARRQKERERSAYLEAFTSHLKAVHGDARLKDEPDMAKVEAARRLHQAVRQTPERAFDLKHLREIGYAQLRTQEKTQAQPDRTGQDIAKIDRSTADRIWTLAADANRAGLEAVQKTRAEPLHNSPAAYKQFVADTLHRLDPDDSQRLHALTTYSQRASEDFFRVFPEIDHLRRAIEVGRTQQLSDRTQSLDRVYHPETGHPEREMAAEVMKRARDEIAAPQERASSSESVSGRAGERGAVASEPRQLPWREDHRHHQTPSAPQIEMPERANFSWGR